MNPAVEQFVIAAAVGGAFSFLVLRPLLAKKNGKACGGGCCVPKKKGKKRRA